MILKIMTRESFFPRRLRKRISSAAAINIHHPVAVAFEIHLDLVKGFLADGDEAFFIILANDLDDLQIGRRYY